MLRLQNDNFHKFHILVMGRVQMFFQVRDKAGAPAIFGSNYFDELKSLKGKVGGSYISGDVVKL